MITVDRTRIYYRKSKMHVLNLKKKLARDFYVVTLPTIVKIQDSPSPSPYQDISESESDTESRGVGSGSGDEMLTLETQGTVLCRAMCGNTVTMRVESQNMQSAWCQPECCHQAVVTWWLSPSLWSLWSMTPTCHYHAESGIQPPDIRHIMYVVTVYWKNIQNFTKHDILSQPAGGTEAFVRSL